MEERNLYKKFMDVVEQRYSCREYDSTRQLPKEDVALVVEAARLAPSAVNRQPWSFVAVTDVHKKEEILIKSRPAFKEAPILLVCCGHHDQAWHRPVDGKDHTDIDVAIAVEHICLSATSMGLATCWVCSFDVEATRRVLNLPDEVEPVALIPLGYAKTDVVPEKKRKELDEILTWQE